MLCVTTEVLYNFFHHVRSCYEKLPIGVQTFEDMRRGDYIYVDKTQYIYKLIKPYKGIYFLSRPRRFGKSLTISTLEALFKNKKELFKDLWIYSSDYQWKEYPVIRLDMSNVARDSAERLTKDLKVRLAGIAQHYDILLDETETLETLFMTLIETLQKKFNEQVVILIDEYDKPILDNILKKDVVLPIRDVLRNFYGIMKAQDANIKFVFVIGVTKFARVSIFSGLNNLEDITTDPTVATMLGYTQEELETYFDEHIHAFMNNKHIEKGALLDQIKLWYNGFRFSKKDIRVYNPYSPLLLFKRHDFMNYWFETATPDFLIQLIKHNRYDFYEIETREIREESLSTFELENINILALLYQTGYLTIRTYNDEERIYQLGYPNKEIELAFTENLIAGLSEQSLDDLQSTSWNLS